jgi:hypothetical protein
MARAGLASRYSIHSVFPAGKYPPNTVLMLDRLVKESFPGRNANDRRRLTRRCRSAISAMPAWRVETCGFYPRQRRSRTEALAQFARRGQSPAPVLVFKAPVPSPEPCTNIFRAFINSQMSGFRC